MSSEYFDLTTTGVAYINRFRLNKPQQGKPYYSITLAAMRGKANDEGHIEKTYIDCNLVGDAIQMAERIEPYFDEDNDPSIMVKFVVGDLELRPFEYSSGERKGERGFSLKARLFDIKWFKIGGRIFYSDAEQQRFQPTADVEQSLDSPIDQGTDEAIPATTGDYLPPVVRLVKDDPYFDERKAQLKEQGYRWNRESEVWQLPESAAV